ncbi:MAG: glycosyltransferase family 39 protein, partial [bacterium]
NAAVGLAGIAGCWSLAARLAGPRAGLCAAVLLALTPRWYGHMFNNPKDIPFAAAYVWALSLLIGVARRLPRPSWRALLGFGGVAGLAMGVRPGGVLLPAYVALAAGWWIVRRRGWTRAPRLAGRVAAAGATAYGVMLLCWPWALRHPLAGPIRALTLLSWYPYNGTTLFAGREYAAGATPRDYALHYLAITTPEVTLALLAGGIVWLAWKRRIPSDPGLALAALGAVLPLAWVTLARSSLYHEVRHLLFTIPPLTALAGAALEGLLRRTLDRRGARRWAVAAYLGSSAAWQAGLMIRLHPCEYVYYNQLVGGLPGAAGRYELDYWGASYPEAVRELVARLRREAGASFPARRFRLFVWTQEWTAEHCYPPNFETVRSPARADFVLGTTQVPWDSLIPGTTMFAVRRLGVDLCRVKDMRGARRRSTGESPPTSSFPRASCGSRPRRVEPSLRRAPAS